MAGVPTPRDLFGGAIVAYVPEFFVDASDFRPVPSSQEVYVSLSDQTELNFVIDILQRVNLPDIDACKEHFDDVIDGMLGTTGKIFQISGPIPAFPTKLGPSIPTYLVQGTISNPYYVVPPPTDPNNDEVQNNTPYMVLLMFIFRLEAHETDLVVTVNCPVNHRWNIIHEKRLWHPAYDHPPNGLPNETDPVPSPLVDDAVTLLQGLVATLEVKDWGLFHPEDEQPTRIGQSGDGEGVNEPAN